MRGNSFTALPAVKYAVHESAKCSWLLALLLVAGTLAFSSCVNQEGVAPAEGELKGG
jgi:hypothetical protein